MARRNRPGERRATRGHGWRKRPFYEYIFLLFHLSQSLSVFRREKRRERKKAIFFLFRLSSLFLSLSLSLSLYHGSLHFLHTASISARGVKTVAPPVFQKKPRLSFALLSSILPSFRQKKTLFHFVALHRVKAVVWKVWRPFFFLLLLFHPFLPFISQINLVFSLFFQEGIELQSGECRDQVAVHAALAPARRRRRMYARIGRHRRKDRKGNLLIPIPSIGNHGPYNVPKRRLPIELRIKKVKRNFFPFRSSFSFLPSSYCFFRRPAKRKKERKKDS